jgi:hypothetical protein
MSHNLKVIIIYLIKIKYLNLIIFFAWSLNFNVMLLDLPRSGQASVEIYFKYIG